MHPKGPSFLRLLSRVITYRKKPNDESREAGHGRVMLKLTLKSPVIPNLQVMQVVWPKFATKRDHWLNMAWPRWQVVHLKINLITYSVKRIGSELCQIPNVPVGVCDITVVSDKRVYWFESINNSADLEISKMAVSLKQDNIYICYRQAASSDGGILRGTHPTRLTTSGEIIKTGHSRTNSKSIVRKVVTKFHTLGWILCEYNSALISLYKTQKI